MANLDPSTIRLLANEPISQIQDLTTGYHTVAQVNDRYLVKQSRDLAAIEREAVGLYLFGRLSRAVPHLITRGADFLVSESLPQASTASQAIACGLISQSQVEAFVATFMAKIYWKYQQRSDNLTFFPFISWSSRTTAIAARLDQSFNLLKATVDHNVLRKLAKQVAIFATQSTHCKLTLLHRDIHLDNILVSTTNGYPRMMLIDVEHCMEGPIELELQNALFWQDDKSLNTQAIQTLLVNQFRIPYSRQQEAALLSLYIADQLTAAAEKSDRNKLAQLNKLAQIRLR